MESRTLENMLVKMLRSEENKEFSSYGDVVDRVIFLEHMMWRNTLKMFEFEGAVKEVISANYTEEERGDDMYSLNNLLRTREVMSVLKDNYKTKDPNYSDDRWPEKHFHNISELINGLQVMYSGADLLESDGNTVKRQQLSIIRVLVENTELKIIMHDRLMREFKEQCLNDGNVGRRRLEPQQLVRMANNSALNKILLSILQRQQIKLINVLGYDPVKRQRVDSLMLGVMEGLHQRVSSLELDAGSCWSK
jgi:hypothetical protein